MFQKDVFLNFAGGFKVADPGTGPRGRGGGDLTYYDSPVAEGSAAQARSASRAKCAPPPHRTAISEAARPGVQGIIVSSYLAKGGKRPKGIEFVPINSIISFPGHSSSSPLKSRNRIGHGTDLLPLQ